MKRIEEIETTPIETCDQCGGTTKLAITVGGRSSVVPCICDCQMEEYNREEERQREKRRKNKRKRVLGRTFGRCEYIPTFDDCDAYTPSQALTVTKAYVERFTQMRKAGEGLLLYGEAGNGKTYLAECIASALCFRFNVQVMTADSVIATSLFDDGLETLTRNDLVVLDDLGTHRDTSYADERIFSVVNDCYNRYVPMIVTTNLTPQKMMQEQPGIKQRTYSRILERCLPVKIESNRQRLQAENYEKMKKELGLL